jgi:hypothetical protein
MIKGPSDTGGAFFVLANSQSKFATASHVHYLIECAMVTFGAGLWHA